MKKTILVFVALMLIFSWASIQAAPKKVTINYWYTVNDADPTDMRAKWHRDNLKLFAEAYPDIEVIPTCVANSDQYLTKITTEMAANNAPDIFQTWLSGRLQPFVKAGRVYALDAEIAKEPLKSTIIKANLVNGTFDGKVYALPNLMTSELLFYNKEIFAQYNVDVPKTWNEFINAIKKFKANGIVPFSLANKESWCGTMPYMYIYDRIAGPGKWEETCLTHTGRFTEPEYVEAAKKLLEMRDAGAFPENYNSLNYAEGKTLFVEGKAAMYMMGTWELGSLISSMGDKLDFFSFPVIPGGKGDAGGYVASFDDGFAISSRSTKKEAALKFLQFLFSKERQKEFAEYGFLITTRDIPYNKNKIPALTNKIISTLSTRKSGFTPWDNPLGVNVGKELNNSTQAILMGAHIKQTLANLDKINVNEFGYKGK